MTESVTPDLRRDLESLIRTPEVQRPRVYVCRACGLSYAEPREHDAEECGAGSPEIVTARSDNFSPEAPR